VGGFNYGLFPSCVLVESPFSTQMLRIYPGVAPGTCVVYSTGGSLTPIADDDELEACKAGLAGAAAVLRGEDFPAAESNQRGIENGLQQVIFGRSEALVQHLHRVWDESSNTMQTKGNQSNEERIR
jgi:carnitine monooxygenase subunit